MEEKQIAKSQRRHLTEYSEAEFDEARRNGALRPEIAFVPSDSSFSSTSSILSDSSSGSFSPRISRSIFPKYWRNAEQHLRSMDCTLEEEEEDKNEEMATHKQEPVPPTTFYRKSQSSPELATRELRSCLRSTSNGKLTRSTSSVSFSAEVDVTEYQRPMESWASDGWSQRFTN